jgi:membrane associated rhomboid family serine protease
LFIPYAVDVPMRRLPAFNWGLLVVTIYSFFANPAFTSGPYEVAHHWVLSDWSIDQLVGHMFLHADIMHLIGNMLFLWVFGNAICAKIGNIAFAPTYLALGVLAGAAHLTFDGAPAVGASGAINGVVGMFLFWYPRNQISCVWLLGTAGAFEFSSFWAILTWLAFDILGAMIGMEGVGYIAHLAGFVGGFALAAGLTALNVMPDAPYEQSVLDLLRE